MSIYLSANKEQVLNTNDLLTKIIDVPEWNCNVIVRTMSGFVREEFEEYWRTLSGPKCFRAILCAFCIVDEEGNRIFDNSDIDALSKKSASALDKIADACVSLNKIGQDEIGELEKNSDGAQSE